ncbi:response regulator [Leptospira biflexa]|uniref:ATP-binding response regulator n=1 Tax=Leptospira biflexa TaxID=172 RepID=UPI0010916576|nr:response regulator [Leptospira biflexa]TGM48234.1 response regulator [Leptospira biflexa]TGM49300.1 response regulator [Leptospira biflexa]
METLNSLTRVILLEDDPTISILYHGLLQKKGMEVTSFAKKKPAIDFLTENHLQNQNILITDLQLPDGNGLDFVREVRKVNKQIPIVVITSTEDPKQIIEVMKEDVQEYLIKPVIPTELISRIEYQLSNKKDEYIHSDYEREKILSLEKLLEWYSYKNTRIQKGDFNSNELNKNLFYGLRTSLAQGAGLGVITELIDIIKTMPRAENGGVILDPDILKILEENAVYSKKVLDRFSEIEEVIFDRIKLEEVSVIKLFNEMLKVKEEISSLLQLKDQVLVIPEYKGSNLNSKMFKWNSEYFRKILYELLLNAMRFSKPSSKIFFLIHFDSDGIYLSTINSYADEESAKIGISNRFLELIFEPFFRINQNVYDQHGSLDFGIGLSFVKQTIEKFGGTIHALNLVDHTNQTKETKIEFKMYFPYSSSAK